MFIIENLENVDTWKRKKTQNFILWENQRIYFLKLKVGLYYLWQKTYLEPKIKISTFMLLYRKSSSWKGRGVRLTLVLKIINTKENEDLKKKGNLILRGRVHMYPYLYGITLGQSTWVLISCV